MFQSYQQYHSSTQLPHILEELVSTHIRAGYQQRMMMAVAFLDLTAAYDAVYTEGVLYKLLKIIPWESKAKFINNMLCDRKLQVILNEKVSKRTPTRLSTNSIIFYFIHIRHAKRRSTSFIMPTVEL